jgi:hypothetical protein
MNGETLFFSLYWLANISILILSFLSTKLIFNKKRSDFLHFFYLYPLIGTIHIVCFELNRFDVFMSYPSYLTTFIFSFFHFSFFSLLLISITGGIKKNPIIFLIFLFFSLIVLISIYFDTLYHKYFTPSVGNLGLTIISAYYFVNLFKEKSVINLYKDPGFYIATGLFFSSIVMIPILLFFDYFRSHFGTNIFYLISSIAPISSLLLYGFLIKAVLCIRTQQ